MYSKFILPSNWTSLSSNYSFDKTVSFNNMLLPVAGNLSVYYSSLVDSVKDFSNNNYSNFILTKNLAIPSIVSKKLNKTSLNGAACVIAVSLDGGVISDETRFLRFNPNLTPVANTVLDLDLNNFFEIIFLSDKDLIIKKDMNSYFVYMAADDNSNLVTYLTSTKPFEDSAYDREKIKFNYFRDKDKISIYKPIQKDLYFISIIDNRVDFIIGSLDDIQKFNILNYIRIGDLKLEKFSLDSVSYKRDIARNNLNIDRSRSSYNINSNFLNHYQYNSIADNSLDFNFFPLKNHFNITDEAVTVNNNLGYRDYTSIFTGSNEEGGSDKITLGYKSKYFTIELPPDKTTWFHLPYDYDQPSVKINDSNFIRDGAVGGSSPIFSDKIWKKIAGYAYTSNTAAASGDEQTGRWLCSWLSGGPNNTLKWIDRYYNPDVFTAIDALKLPPNVDYTPEYAGKRGLGITDVPSELSLDPGVWYAYSRMGKKTSQQILSGIAFTYIKQFDTFTNQNNSPILAERDFDGDYVYNFNGNEMGKFSAPLDLSYNNFSVSFFATRENWNKNNTYSILGNYVDRGFGIINNNKFNPYIYHINDKKLYVLNSSFDIILTIDTSVYIDEENYKIEALFRRDTNENIHIVTSNFKLLEFNCIGTLVDFVDLKTLVGANSSIISYTNNGKYGFVKTINNAHYKIDLTTNKTVLDNNSVITIDSSDLIIRNNMVIDAYEKVYTFNGYNPVLKGTSIYYKDLNSRKILRYSVSDETLKTYINSLSTIISFNFNQLDETVILYNDFVDIYDELGNFKERKAIKTDFESISSCNLIVQDLCNDKYQTSVHFIDEKGVNYLYNLNDDSYKSIEKNNSLYNNLSSFLFPEKSYDMSNYNYVQGIVDNKFPLPSYNFKIKLFNQLNSEDVRFLNIVVLGETLDVGTHHFCVSLDTLEGYFTLFVDGKVYSTVTFPAKKYSLLNIFSNGFTVGSTPFYNNIDFFDFYKKDIIKNTDDLKIEKFKFFTNTINSDEAKLLYYEKYPPKSIKVNIETGERNYLETITRTFKHKMQGSKSNLINLHINNSLMVDRDVQKLYESIILRELKQYLPSNVRVNKIDWLNTINSLDRMVIGNYSIKNTLTDTGDLKI